VPAAGEQLPATRSALTLTRERAKLLGRRQLAWTAWVTAASGWFALLGITGARPELAIALALSCAVLGVRPGKLLLAPLVVAGVAFAGLAASGLGLPAALAAGAAAGAFLVGLGDEPADRMDYVNGTLAGAAATGLGLWTAGMLVPAALPLGVEAIVSGLVFGLVSAQALVPITAVWTRRPALPNERAIKIRLAEPYRAAPKRAVSLYRQLKSMHPGRPTLGGLEEVACWVYRLAGALQTLDRELLGVDAEGVRERIVQLTEKATGDDDTFTRERRLATAQHLETLLNHTQRLGVERERMYSLQEYALAYLEEARMGLLLAKKLPGETAPARLDEVLARLRTHAQEGETRRQTARELTTLRSL